MTDEERLRALSTVKYPLRRLLYKEKVVTYVNVGNVVIRTECERPEGQLIDGDVPQLDISRMLSFFLA